MTRSKLQRLTVPELRQLAKAAGLPTYQIRGRRLLKSDLVRMIARHHRQPRPPKRRAKRSTLHAPRSTHKPLTDHQAILQFVAGLPSTAAASMALARVLIGTDQPQHRRTLDARWATACRLWRDAAADDDREYDRRAAVYLDVTQRGAAAAC